MDHHEPLPVAEKRRQKLTKLPKHHSAVTTLNTTAAAASASSTPRDSKLSSPGGSTHHEQLHHPTATATASAADGQARFSLTEQSTAQLIGPAFNADDLITQLATTSQSTAARYTPSPLATPRLNLHAFPAASLSSSSSSKKPQLLHANTLDERLLPTLRPSQSHLALGSKMDRITPPRSETSSSGTKSPRQRYSDEAKPESSRKKSMFASFLNGVKGPPRRPTISSPVNPTHVHHVSFDQDTGTLTVCDS
jgi:p21-activated kinase 1